MKQDYFTEKKQIYSFTTVEYSDISKYFDCSDFILNSINSLLGYCRRNILFRGVLGVSLIRVGIKLGGLALD